MLALLSSRGTYPFAFCFRRSAQRFFIASAMRLRPSGLSLRLRVVAVFGVTVAPVALTADLRPLGRPGPFGADSVVPASSVRACCNFDICASISAIIRLTSTCYLRWHRINPIIRSSGSDNSNVYNAIFDDTEGATSLQIICNFYLHISLSIALEHEDIHKDIRLKKVSRRPYEFLTLIGTVIFHGRLRSP